MVPDPQGLAIVFGKPKVDCPGEELLATVNPARRQEFLSANRAQLCAKFGAEYVLPAIPARKGKVRRPIAPPPREVGDQHCILVVGMRCNVEHRAHFSKATQLVKNRGAGELLRPGNERSGKDCSGASHRSYDLVSAE